MNLFIDLETVPGTAPELRDELAQAISPPGTYKKPESIAQWETESKPGLVEEAYRKTALSGLFGEIAVIGWALGDGPIESVHRDPRFYDQPENELLQEFWRAISKARVQCWVGHNLAAFDLRFLYQRSLVNRVEPSLNIPVSSPPWKGEVFDTMTAWAGYGGRVSLDKVCRALNIPSPKDGIDGSKVYDAILEGRIEDVAAYCRADVEATRQVYRRLNWEKTL